MAHILVVDDDVRIAHGVEDYLRYKHHWVTVCSNGVQALDAVAKQAPDLIILDVGMPGLNGLEVCRRVRSMALSVPLPIVFVSGRDTLDDKIAGFEAGADDYMVKPFDLRELEVRVNALLRRLNGANAQSDPSELRVGNLRLNTKTFKAYADDRDVQLTPVEYELLRYLMQRAGEVISAEQLLQDVWRYYPGTGDAAVVRVQIMNLRDKIERDRSRPVFIQTIYRHGYMVANV
jgi:two-component system, OmpR family, response regulator RpaA